MHVADAHADFDAVGVVDCCDTKIKRGATADGGDDGQRHEMVAGVSVGAVGRGKGLVLLYWWIKRGGAGEHRGSTH